MAQFKLAGLRDSSIEVIRTSESIEEGHTHFHCEYQLIYILKGTGIRMISGLLDEFVAGDLFLIAGWIPHLWRYKSKEEVRDAILIKFWIPGSDFHMNDVPEQMHIHALVSKASSGIIFSRRTTEQAHARMLRLCDDGGIDRVGQLMDILVILARDSDQRSVVPVPEKHVLQPETKDPLMSVVQQVARDYDQDLQASVIATSHGFTLEEFGVFFVQKTGQTFDQYVDEFRIIKACQILLAEVIPITEVAKRVGYRSVTIFNRKFKYYKGIIPQDYRMKFRSR